MRSVLGTPSEVENCRAVRSDVYASDRAERASASISEIETPGAGRGITPTTGIARLISMSSGDLNVSSRYSRPKALAAPTIVPARTATIRLNKSFGDDGEPGTCA